MTTLLTPVVRRLVCSIGTYSIAVATPIVVEAEIIDRIFAVVAGEVITMSDTRAAIELGLVSTEGAADPLGTALSELIERELILAEVERFAPPEPRTAAIQARLDQIRRRFATVELFERTLASAGLTEDRVREIARDDLRSQAYLDQRFTATAQPSEEEIVRYYQEHRSEFVRGGSAQPLEAVREIVKTRLVAARRDALIADWISGLRRRTEILVLYLPSK